MTKQLIAGRVRSLSPSLCDSRPSCCITCQYIKGTEYSQDELHKQYNEDIICDHSISIQRILSTSMFISWLSILKKQLGHKTEDLKYMVLNEVYCWFTCKIFKIKTRKQ